MTATRSPGQRDAQPVEPEPAEPEPAEPEPAERRRALAGTVPPAQPWGHRVRVLSVAAAREALRDRALLVSVLLLPPALAGAVVLVAQALAPRGWWCWP